MRAVRFLLSHPRWLALALGALAATGFQPLGLWPLALAALVGDGRDAAAASALLALERARP